MELCEVILSHYVDFSEVDPVSLASKLLSLTNDDRDQIMCNTRSGHPYGVKKLYDVIIGKVTWPELNAALRKENLTELAKTLEEEYYQQHPMARPNPQDENLNSGVNQFEQEPTDSSTDSNINNRASARANINFVEKACSSASTKVSLDKNVKDGATIVIIAQTVNFQCGDNNCMNAISNADYDGTTADTECGEQYEVCVENEVSKILDNHESLENVMNNDSVLYSTLPTEPTTPQNVSPQFSSSSSDSQDGGRPNVHCPNETAEHTSEKLIFQERNGDEMVYSTHKDNISSHDNTNTMSESHGHNVRCPNETADHTSEKLVFQERNDDEMVYSTHKDNISSHDNTNTMSESHGHYKIRDVICFEELGIALRKRDKTCEEGEEEETELKKLK